MSLTKTLKIAKSWWLDNIHAVRWATCNNAVNMIILIMRIINIHVKGKLLKNQMNRCSNIPHMFVVSILNKTTRIKDFHCSIRMTYLNIYLLSCVAILGTSNQIQVQFPLTVLHTSHLGNVKPRWNRFKPYSKIFLLTVPRWCFVDPLCYFCPVYVMLSCVSAYWCPVVTCWKRADPLALVCDV